MKKELPKQYDPKQVENQIYEMWMENDCFKAEADPDKKPYSIVMPPPNVTGQLHMGHALDSTLQDILTRYKRMQGYSALSLAKVALSYGERSMNTHAVIYPYWENAARLTEDYAALFLLLMVLFAITPAVFVLVWLIRTIKRLITEAKDKTVTAIEEKIEQKKEEHYVRTGI